MSGICGDITFDATPASVAAIQSMMAALLDRGPDAGGIHAQNHVAFGHRRLTVTDPERRAQQPLIDPALGLLMVFDGCLYNAAELRTELSAAGYTFHSQSDAEVVQKAWHAWGTECAARLDGMFAFAVNERDSGRVVLARDRYGAKPLYYTDAPAHLRFASSIAALVAAGDISDEIDATAVDLYMKRDGRLPAPMTLICDIRALPPGGLRVINENGSQTDHLFWTPPPRKAETGLTKETATASFIDAFDAAVARRLAHNPKPTILFTGGAEAHLLASAMGRLNQSDVTLVTENGDTVGQMVAEHYGFQLKTVTLSSDQIDATLTRIFAHLPEPVLCGRPAWVAAAAQRIAEDSKIMLAARGARRVFGPGPLRVDLPGLIDAMAMSKGVQARLPFFDPALVDLATRLPATFRDPLSPDWVINLAAKECVPDALWSGFDQRSDASLTAGSTTYALELVSSERLKSRNLFDDGELERLTALSVERDDIWHVAGLELWLRAQGL